MLREGGPGGGAAAAPSSAVLLRGRDPSCVHLEHERVRESEFIGLGGVDLTVRPPEEKYSFNKRGFRVILQGVLLRYIPVGNLVRAAAAFGRFPSAAVPAYSVAS